MSHPYHFGFNHPNNIWCFVFGRYESVVGYPEAFRDIQLFLQANCGIVPQNWCSLFFQTLQNQPTVRRYITKAVKSAVKYDNNWFHVNCINE
jgi:hypothetical protein